MRKLWLMCLTLGFAGVAATIPEVGDLPKIERTIQKEPVYKSKTPKYCLLVLGPKAQTRVWMVLDGDVFYIDRNGSGRSLLSGQGPPDNACHHGPCLITLHLGKFVALPIPIAGSAV